MSTKITTPVGRIVWGNPLTGRPKKDDSGKPVTKDGQPVIEYSFGLAIPKADFGPVGEAMQAEATAIVGAGQRIPPDFAFKMKDGDTDTDKKGNPLRDKPGYAGCYVLACSTEIPVRCFGWDGSKWVQATAGIKTGDYGRAELQIRGHGAKPGARGSKPGLYINPDQFVLDGSGEAIVNSANPDEAFGQGPAALPQGASATPTAAAPTMPAGNGSPFAASPPAPTPAAPVQPDNAFPWGGKK